jgi:hypothetical protein
VTPRVAGFDKKSPAQYFRSAQSQTSFQMAYQAFSVKQVVVANFGGAKLMCCCCPAKTNENRLPADINITG